MELQKLIIETLRKEVIPAVGCTEPVAVALACAKAKEMTHEAIEKVNILVSPNIYKNGLGVGIPNTNEVGLYIAAALGIVGGKSEKKLEVLQDITPVHVKKGKELIHSEKISIGIKDTKEKIYIEVIVKTKKDKIKVMIEGKHDLFVYISQNEKILLDERKGHKKNKDEDISLYDLKIVDLIEEIEKISYDNLAFLLEGLYMNEKVALEGLKKKVGMGVGMSLYENIQKGILSDDLMNQAMMLTAAASDVRMSGENISVMSSNGSGNNGLTAILPIVAYKNKFSVKEEDLTKALAISHMINSYIKFYIGRLSALCGCGVAAATGASVAIVWLMGGNKKQINGAIQNMLGNISGMICDGAKVGCALKLSTAASTAIQSALLALNEHVIPHQNGIIGESAEDTIRNLGKLSIEGMENMDQVILQVMKSMESIA
ncbi:serine dehydratase subunit alpha family protein [Inediibacterium massiliense]|uniref:L-cysteine desulfidase family protein n=1 Tax=Inediibacterium massiliense TaxID=1658111 RepID=UPI0006B45A2F|nr:L-serine ammonia-lyase, iron-sulfur-dependent, subunit alpha [Inediibacterium massiliense]